VHTVAIIGVGRVGGALAVSLPPDSYRVSHLVFRESPPSGVVTGRWPNAVVSVLDGAGSIDSDIVLLATQDFELSAVVDSLIGKIPAGSTVLHTSGSRSSEILAPLERLGCSVGSLHPLVAIPSPDLGPERFAGAYFCVEGDRKAVALATDIARALGGNPFSIDTRSKTLYHAAAVTACGHLVALFDAAVEMMTRAGLSAHESKAILMPLVQSAVDNLEAQSNADALTGTFARADTETFTRHISALNEIGSEELLEIYLLLGERSLQLAAKQGTNTERIEMMRAKVTIAKSKLKW
jgi:predicted short-subunit dehydrogenase-like oxidoreductase (DUF2520 family)